MWVGRYGNHVLACDSGTRFQVRVSSWNRFSASSSENLSCIEYRRRKLDNQHCRLVSPFRKGAWYARSRRRLRVVGSVDGELLPGLDRITATLETPLGVILAQNSDDGSVFIESIEPGSHADMSGLLKPGDVLVACSAIAMASAQDTDISTMSKAAMYNRNSRGRKGGCCSTGCVDCPFTLSNWKKITFDCRGKSFDTVIAALSSNNARWARTRHRPPPRHSSSLSSLSSSPPSSSRMVSTITLTVDRHAMIETDTGTM